MVISAPILTLLLISWLSLLMSSFLEAVWDCFTS
jgi:hypothetical protein